MSGLTWDRPTTRKLLQIIADDPGYRHTLFGKALYKGKENRKWVATRDLCLTLFQEEAGWIASMRKKGLLKREGGRWVATDEWTGRVNDPVKGLLNRLIKEMEDGFFVNEYGIDPRWTQWEDIPDKRKRGESAARRAYPHYFILHDLVSNHAPYRPLVDTSTASISRASTSTDAAEIAAPTRTRASKRLRSSSPVRFEPYAKDGHAGAGIRLDGEEENSWSNPVIVDSSPPSPVIPLASAGPGPSTMAARANRMHKQPRQRVQLPSPSPTPSQSDLEPTVAAPLYPSTRPRKASKAGARQAERTPANRTRSDKSKESRPEIRTAEEVIIALDAFSSSDESSISAIFGEEGKSSDGAVSEVDSETSDSSFDFGNILRHGRTGGVRSRDDTRVEGSRTSLA